MPSDCKGDLKKDLKMDEGKFGLQNSVESFIKFNCIKFLKAAQSNRWKADIVYSFCDNFCMLVCSHKQNFCWYSIWYHPLIFSVNILFNYSITTWLWMFFFCTAINTAESIFFFFLISLFNLKWNLFLLCLIKLDCFRR